jgi:hypothetical protein
MSEKNSIFRKKSLDRIESPEQLNDYIRVTSPGIWIFLAAAIVLLVGIILWGIFGHLVTRTDLQVNVEGGTGTCYVTAVVSEDINEDSRLEVEEYSVPVELDTSQSVIAASVLTEEALSLEGLTGSEILYPVTAQLSLGNGTYNGALVIEKIKPISFIISSR